MSKQAPSERQAEHERAAKRNACPDCGLPNAKRYGDGGCLARCPEKAFVNVAQCRLNTIARLRSELAAVDRALGILEGRVSAMTSEGLHSKADIAKQLAWRDQVIERLRERNQLEAAVVEALIAERTARDAIPTLSLKQGEFPSQEFWNANHHLENVHVDTEKALDALLAHRAQKGAER